jgi:hypothetical protein
MSLALLTTAGTPQLASSPLAVSLSSSSPQGQFSATPTGPWSSALTLTIPAGSNAAGPFYYQDTLAGSPVLTAAASGVTSGTQTETVLPGLAVIVRVTPASATVTARKTQSLTAAGADQFGNPVPLSATWSVAPAELGSVTPKTGPGTTFTAGAKAGSGTVTATANGLAGNSVLIVTPGPIQVASIRYGIGKDALLVTPTVVDAGGRPVPGAALSVLVRRRGYRYFSSQGTTAANGRKTFRLRPRPGCYRTTVIRVSAPGYRWDRKTPANRFCK